MQPLGLHFEQGEDNIPDQVLIGHTETGQIVGIPTEDLLKSHIYIKGRTGVGKSRMVALLLMQLYSCGYRILFTDPLGEVYTLMLHWFSWITRKKYDEKSQFPWFSKNVLKKILFWDLSAKDHHLRHNMLQPFPGEDLDDVIARQIKFYDALFSSESGQDGMELQLQRRSNLVSLVAVFAATGTPMVQARNFIYDREYRDRLLKQAEQRSSLDQVIEAVLHFRYIDEEFKARAAEKLNSLETALSPFFENRIIRNFLLTSQNNVDFTDIMDNQSLFIRISNDLPSKKILMNYLYTVFFGLSERRKKNCDHLFLGSDESACVFSSMMADNITKVRNYKVHIISSHQSLGQLLTPEKMKIGETIDNQSDIKIYFKNSYQESEQVVNEIFSPTGKKPKLIEITTTTSKTAGQGSSEGVSEAFSREQGVGVGYNIQENMSDTLTESKSYTITYGSTESIQNQWSEAEGQNKVQSWNVQNAFTYSEAATQGLQQLQGDGLTFTIGEGKSLMRLETESGSLTIAESKGEVETTSESNAQTQGSSQSESYSRGTGQGTAINYQSRGGGQVITVLQGTPVVTGSTLPSVRAGETLNKFENASQANGNQKSQAWSSMQGIAHSMSKSVSRAKTKGHTVGQTMGLSKQESMALAKSFQEGVSLAKQYGRAIQDSLGHTRSVGKSSTYTHGGSDSTALSIQKALQQGESIARMFSQGFGKNFSQNVSQGITQGRQIAMTNNVGVTMSISWKLVYYSIQEELRLLAQEIRSLPQRMFYLSIGGRPPIKLITEDCFTLPTRYGKIDFFDVLTKHFFELPTKKDIELVIPKDGLSPETYEYIEVTNNENDFKHFFWG